MNIDLNIKINCTVPISRKQFRFKECFEVHTYWHDIHLISVVVIESRDEHKELRFFSRSLTKLSHAKTIQLRQ